MNSPPLVTLTTDFGTRSEGGGIIEATVLRLCPHANVVHLTHEVRAYDIADAAREMECVLSIQSGVHVCVVDPGVGGPRRGLAVRIPGAGIAIGPDNGALMSLARRAGEGWQAYAIENEALFRHPMSTTFHGRDVFGAVAGHLAAGTDLASVGPLVPAAELVAAPFAEAMLKDGSAVAIVLHVNRFGSCILNLLDDEIFGASRPDRFVVWDGNNRRHTVPAARTFSDVPERSPLLYPDSYGRTALGCNRASAAEILDLGPGSRVRISSGE